MRTKSNSKIHSFLYVIAMTVLTIAIAAVFVHILGIWLYLNYLVPLKINFKYAFGVVVLNATAAIVAFQCGKRCRGHFTTNAKPESKNR